MSCFMVADERINRIVTFLAFEQGSSAIDAVDVPKEVFGDLTAIAGRHALGQSIYDLNRRAFQARYEDRYASDAPERSFAYQHVAGGTDVRVYKDLCCLLYQCSEGDIPETSLLYHALEERAQVIAERYIRRSAEYNKEPW